ncbi:unnamed protein product [Eruca vesicaria subsp. sativa]|uniref:Uncharacterized protein n=1 Tax=Eruca vesicaria subsp. sativa TaxID=29727 RepID=A0ABC8JEH5_ERUVS|nr:unnamed protein product [Eruca vesicaria subsp. sativa]
MHSFSGKKAENGEEMLLLHLFEGRSGLKKWNHLNEEKVKVNGSPNIFVGAHLLLTDLKAGRKSRGGDAYPRLSNRNRLETFSHMFNEGSIYSISWFDLNNFKLSDPPSPIRFKDLTSFVQLTYSFNPILEELFS